MEINDDANNGDEKHFRLSYSLDRDGYFRHECGSCGRQFKTKPTPDQLVSAVQPAFSEVNLAIEYQEEGSGDEAGELMLGCPYCGYRAGISEMLTHSFADYIQRYIFTEYLEPQIHQMLEEFSDSIGRPSGSTSGGLFSIEITAQYSRGVRSARPISGPDAPDMNEVRFLCCQNSMKMESPSKHITYCPFCHEEVALF